jgi:hypothetical protein
MPALALTSPAPLPPFTPQFLCYKTLKKCLKNIPEEVVKVAGPGGAGGSVARRDLAPGETSTLPPASVRLTQLTDEQRAFIKTLNNELQKFNTFFINRCDKRQTLSAKPCTPNKP